MKKIWTFVCLCAVCVMIPVMALAVTQKEWNQQCVLKTNASVTFFLTQKSTDDSELATGTDIDMWTGGTLSAGTYVKQIGFDKQLNMWILNYFNGSSVVEVYIRDYRIVTATSTVSIYDGKNYESLAVPEALIGDNDALCRYLAGEYSGYTFTVMADGKTVHKEKKSGASAGTNSEKTAWKSLKQQAEEAAAKLNVDLEDLQQALVYAPRTGKASLRQRAAGNGKVIEKLMDGTIVYIVEEGKQFSQVLAGNLTGYIINSALEMIDPEQQPLGEGVLSYRGKTSGKTKINMRSDAGSKGRKITTWKIGTEVIVWAASEDEKWYEVEYDGVRLYVQAEYLTITELYEEEAEDEDASEEDDYGDEAEDWEAETDEYGYYVDADDDGYYDDYDDYEEEY